MFEQSSLLNDDQVTIKNTQFNTAHPYRHPISNANSIDRSSQLNQDSNSITGGRSSGAHNPTHHLKHQITLNSSLDIKEFEKKLINLPTFTISDEYARSFFPQSTSNASFVCPNDNQIIKESSSVSTEIICVKNDDLLTDLEIDLDMGKKTTTTTTITTTTTTTIMKTAESIPFIVTSPVVLAKDKQSKSISSGILSKSSNEKQGSNRARSVSIVEIDKEKMHTLIKRRKSDFTVEKKHEALKSILSNKNSMSLKHLNQSDHAAGKRKLKPNISFDRKHSCQIIIENDSNSGNTLKEASSVSSIKNNKSSARSLSSIPYLFSKQQEDQSRRSSSSSCYTSAKNLNNKNSQSTLNRIKQSIQNLIGNQTNENQLYENEKIKSRNSLGPTAFHGISNSFSAIPSYFNSGSAARLSINMSDINHGETSKNKSIDLLEAPNTMRRARSNSASLFKTVRNSMSLGSGQTGVSNLTSKEERKLSQKDIKKLLLRNQKMAKANKPNSEV